MPFEITITPELKRQFVSEVTEHLDNFEKMLMTLEKEPSNYDALNSAFRAIHSIKGNSDYMGLKDISSLSNELEDLLDGIRSRRLSLAQELLSLLFECLDLLREMNSQVAEDDYKETDVSAIVSKIKNVKALVEEEIAPQPAQWW